MHWLFLLLGMASLFGAVRTTSGGAMALLLLLSFAFMAAWVLGWLSSRLDSNRDVRPIIDPAELKRLREVAESRRQQQAAAKDSISNS